MASPPLDPAVQAILNEFVAVFAEHVGLPPRRSCDHTIPLVQGAQPLSVRPYRYAPALKSEIEAQVTDMLLVWIDSAKHKRLLFPSVTGPQKRWRLEILRGLPHA